jgi:hypothetical protein
MALHVAACAIHLHRQWLDGAGCRLKPAVVGPPRLAPRISLAPLTFRPRVLTGERWRGATMLVIRPSPDPPLGAASAVIDARGPQEHMDRCVYRRAVNACWEPGVDRICRN